MPAHSAQPDQSGTPSPQTRRGAAPSTAGVYLSPRMWLLPLLVLLLLGGAGTALYIGGLGSPGNHLKHFPVAVVNQDSGTQTPAGSENLGQNITDEMVKGFSSNDEIDLRVLSWEEAQEQMGKGQIHGAVVIPESFSANATALVSGSLSDTQVTRPDITVYTNPLAGPLASSLATSALDPAVEQANKALGEQLTASAREAQGQAQAELQGELARLGADLPPQLQQQVAPKVDGTSSDLLAEPISVTRDVYNPPPEGAALGMGAFFYSVLLMVVGLSGTVAIHFLVDARLGVAPVELGPRFSLGPPLQPARWKTYLLKWGLVVLGGLPTAGLMMWVASAVGMPIPNGGWFFLTTWLSIVTVSAVTMALITLFGSAGMILSLIYVVFMGLPAASGVVPLEALPGFFTFIARGEPLYQMTMANRAVLYFNADADAGVQSGVIGMLIIMVIAVALAMIFAAVYDRMFGYRALRAAAPA